MTGTTITAPNADNIRGPLDGKKGHDHHRYYETPGTAGLAKPPVAPKGTKSFPVMTVPMYTWNHWTPEGVDSTHTVEDLTGQSTNNPKSAFQFTVQQASPDEFFQLGIVPIIIFCCAIFAVGWGLICGLLIKSIKMEGNETDDSGFDYANIVDPKEENVDGQPNVTREELKAKVSNTDNWRHVRTCIIQNTYSRAIRQATGAEDPATAAQVMDTMFKCGEKITDGAKAFLHKEYIYLLIWTGSFAILLGCTVDLLEMGAAVAPTNFPYTAISFSTGSLTSIMAGYIGMRIAVFTNTRVTFSCCESVHRGFVTAYRGGQVLGFVLVGLGVLNIMIIILIFKAAWYNGYRDEIVAAGRPVNHCPNADAAGFTWANGVLADLRKAWVKTAAASVDGKAWIA